MQRVNKWSGGWILAVAGLLAGAEAAQGTTAAPEMMWDLTDLYPTPEAWNEAFTRNSTAVDGLAGFQGTLGESSTQLLRVLDTMSGVRRLVHLPNKDWTGFDAAAKVAASGTIVAGLNAFGAPIIDRESPAPAPVQFPRDNSPRFRDGKPWPEAIAGANRDAKGRAMGTEGGYTIVNARRLWDAGNNILSFSTDQNYADVVVLEHELKSFSIMFSQADIILLNGNPLANIYEMLDTRVVLKEGKVVVGKR